MRAQWRVMSDAAASPRRRLRRRRVRSSRVLEQIAYLNAGRSGPLATATRDAVQSELDARLRDGPERHAVLRARHGAPRDGARRASRRSSRRRSTAASHSPRARRTAATSSLAGLGLGPDDEVITTTDEHFGLLGPLRASGARVVVTQPDPDAIVAAVTPRTRCSALSQVLWTTGSVLPVRELREATGIPVLVDGAQSVGAIPVDADRLRLPHDLGPEVAVRPGLDGRARRRRPRPAAASRRRATSRRPATSPTGRSTPRPGAARFEPNWWPASTLAGLLAAIGGATRVGLRPRGGCRRPLPGAARDRRRGRHARNRARRSSPFTRPASPARSSRGTRRRRRPRARDSRQRAWSASRAAGGRRTAISTGSWRRSPREAGGCLPVRRRSLFDRRPGAGRARLPLRCMPSKRRAARGRRRPLRREDLAVVDDAALVWERAAVSEHGREPRLVSHLSGRWSSGMRRARETVSFAVETLADASGLEVAGHIWVGGEDAESRPAMPRRYPRACRRRSIVPWRELSTEQRYGAETGRPSSPAIGCSALTTFAMCSSSSRPRSSAPA